MCHHWKGITEACESTLSFSEDASRVFSSSSPAFFGTALVKHPRKLPEYLLYNWYFLLGPIFRRPLFIIVTIVSIRITCLLWDSSCETLSQAAREAGRQTEQVQTQKRLLASFVFVASPVCVDKYIELRLLWIRQTVWNPNSWLGFGTKTFVAATEILYYLRVLFLENPRWIKHSFCSYPHEGLCKGIWICSYTQYATGSRNRTSSSSTN